MTFGHTWLAHMHDRDIDKEKKRRKRRELHHDLFGSASWPLFHHSSSPSSATFSLFICNFQVQTSNLHRNYLQFRFIIHSLTHTLAWFCYWVLSAHSVLNWPHVLLFQLLWCLQCGQKRLLFFSFESGLSLAFFCAFCVFCVLLFIAIHSDHFL